MVDQTPTRKAPSPIETMRQERANPAFDVRRMTYALGGGERDVLLKEKFMKEIERDPNFRLDDIHDLTKDQMRERTMAKFQSMVHYVTNEKLDIFTKRMELISVADPAFWTRFGVHFGLHLGAIRSGATPNQFSYLIEKGVLTLQNYFGCFAMTELAHGSNVAGLETTATFDENADQFIIHTPTVDATKWWIGGAADTALYAVVFAQLIVKGKRYGVKSFIVPLRDPKTFQLLPGITIGDIGKKMGRDGIDNGYIQFTNVRIPRAYMLMKHTQVSRDGDVHEPPLAQLTYGALLQGRTAMVADAANIQKKALVIALRYAAVRRQFKVGHKEFESQILDYPIHQRRLLPLMSQAVAMGFTAIRMTEQFEALTSELESFGSDANEEETKDILDKLKETHATSAGLKAFSTWNALEAIEKCRASMGGHGYSAYTGLSAMYNDQAVQCSWEGDNTILALQGGRSLIASYTDAVNGQKLKAGTAYLSDKDVQKAKCPSDQAATELDVIDRGWQCVSANAIRRAYEVYESFASKGMEKDEALERCSTERFVAAKLHTAGFMFRQFKEALDELPEQDHKNGVRDTLTSICRLYGLWAAEEQGAFFLKYGYYTPQQMDSISLQVDKLCLELRKSAISLTDAFNYSDHIINSPLGISSGDVYATYFAKVKAANPHKAKPAYYETLIKPLLERQPLELDDAEDIQIDDEIEEMLSERSGEESTEEESQ